MSRIETTSAPTAAGASAATPAHEAATAGRLGRHVLTAGVVAVWLVVPVSLVLTLVFNRLVADAGRSDLVQTVADGFVIVLEMLSASTVGAVLTLRRPRHPVRWSASSATRATCCGSSSWR